MSIFFFQCFFSFFFNGTWFLWGLSHSLLLFFSILHLTLFKLSKRTRFFCDTLDYLPAMVTPPWWPHHGCDYFYLPQMVYPLFFSFPTHFFVLLTHANTHIHTHFQMILEWGSEIVCSGGFHSPTIHFIIHVNIF